MHIQESHWPTAAVTSEGNGRIGAVGTVSGLGADGPGASPGTVSTLGAALGAQVGGAGTHGRSAPLRVDAQRNLEHVLRAAREVFGELGYGAPMEDVARRARVGVGTVYRRFPSKDVLVRRIAEEETARLTDQARSALGQEEEPWSALSRFLRTSVASGAGRLLPPQILRVGVEADESAVVGDAAARAADAAPGDSWDEPRVPQQRQETGQAAGQAGLRVADHPSVPADGSEDLGPGAADLLEVVGRLVDRARASGELRRDVTVADVLLVIATAAPSLPDAAQQAAASARLLDILLEGLRSRPV
ncbi:TetR/AcrR family transcriptional regulator [Streptomyces sp. NBC_00385]|uniref:TetR/AcrR family transcriptional regulator n=1 Tax=Streptomyces sp. NBC_00385 TaxID=2975733 RepID=UPI002DDB17AD|nr:helix-turn-helix domain-containing protein [Streptomyces sp. NBC_00385]WRZ05039.1 TetR/AcrR family transcriptional regulator [Streptomyces sp. NBC_00385]